MKKWISTILGTWFGSGFFPKMPGTFGSFTALALILPSAHLENSQRILIWIFILILGSWACFEVCKNTNQSDNQTLVIDEVLGMGITTLTLLPNSSLTLWVISFILFRFFDVVKPFPIRLLDRWSKTQSLSSWRVGFGVMVDDFVAGIYAGVIVAVLQKFF